LDRDRCERDHQQADQSSEGIPSNLHRFFNQFRLWLVPAGGCG
jgi:hypothetical protein